MADNFPANPVLLVDGDIVAYRCSAQAERTKYCVTSYKDEYDQALYLFDNAKDAKEKAEYLVEWFEDIPAPGYQINVWSRKELEPVENAFTYTEACMGHIAKQFDNAVVEVFLSGERNFRDNLWKTKKYKGNREQPKPTHLKAVREYLKDKWFAIVSNNQEADDDIGIAAMKSKNTVIVSTDKDLDQIPGWHYNFVSGEAYYVQLQDADQFLYEQTISGDSTDNIPGLPGWGPDKARAYLNDNAGELREATIRLFLAEGFDFEYFHEQYSLIHILREPR